MTWRMLIAPTSRADHEWFDVPGHTMHFLEPVDPAAWTWIDDPVMTMDDRVGTAYLRRARIPGWRIVLGFWVLAGFYADFNNLPTGYLVAGFEVGRGPDPCGLCCTRCFGPRGPWRQSTICDNCY